MMPVLLFLFAALQLGDIWTTNRVLAAGGREVNPVVAWFQRRTGAWWWLPKLAAAGVAAVAAVGAGPPLDVWVLGLLDAVFAWVVVHNWRALQRLRPRGGEG